jgi:hypothetical protein
VLVGGHEETGRIEPRLAAALGNVGFRPAALLRMPCERGVVDTQQLGIVVRTGVCRDAYAVGNRNRRQARQRPSHLEQLANHDQAKRRGGGTRRLQVSVRPHAGVVATLGQPDTRHRGTDAPASGVGMHHQLGHRRLRGEVQIAEQRIAVDRKQMSGAVMR